jgi:hypothetical protein
MEVFIARGAIGFDAVKHLVLCRIERRPPRQDVPGPADKGGIMTDAPQTLLAHHLKALKLPTFLRDPSRPYPANERRQLQAQSEQAPLTPC